MDPDTQEGDRVETSNFIDTYRNTQDITDRIKLAKSQFESDTDSWLISYYAAADKLHQRSTDSDQRVINNKQENQIAVLTETSVKIEEEKALTPAQEIFDELGKYKKYFEERRKLAQSGSESPELLHIDRMLNLSRRIIHLQFQYDELDPGNQEVVDWLFAKAESGNMTILSTTGSPSKQYIEFVDSLSQRFKSPMFLLQNPQTEEKPEMLVFPDMFDPDMTAIDFLTHLAHERAHDVYFQIEPHPFGGDEAGNQRYLVFHEYLAILESIRSHGNLSPKLQGEMSEKMKMVFADHSKEETFEIPGYRDQITVKVGPETYAIFEAYMHSLATTISLQRNLIVDAHYRGEVEKVKELFNKLPGIFPPVGDFIPAETNHQG